MSGLRRPALVLGLSLLTAACGRKGPLLYPDQLVPAAPAALSVHQSGAVVKLQFALPDKDRAGRPVQGVVGIKINRRALEAGQRDVCRSCTDDYRLFRTLYLEHLSADSQRFGNSLVVLDGEVVAGHSYLYQIVPFTADGVDGVSIQSPDVSVAAPLPAPHVAVESMPTEIRVALSMTVPLSGRLLGYNLYRTPAAAARSLKPLNREPLKENFYIDESLDRGVQYRYSARALIVMLSGAVVESSESNEAEGMLKDDE